jgi:2-oxoglutarate ferredoxin oxidoreductase subunit gamma
MTSEFLFAGFGGQGVMFAGQLLAYAALDAGYHVTWISSYGPEMRGGTANCTTIISDKPIGSPVVRQPKVAVVFNIASYKKYEPLVAPGGLLITNASLIQEQSTRTDIAQVNVPASTIAEELGDRRIMNMVLLAATITAYPVISLDVLRTALEHHIPAHRRDLLPVNYRALEAGASVVHAKV